MKILLALEDPDTARFLSGFLRRAGHVTRTAVPGNGLPTVLCGDRAHDVWVIEVRTEGERGGLPGCLEGRAEVPVVLVTESGRLDSGWAEGDWKPAAVMGKPMDLPALMEVLNAVAAGIAKRAHGAPPPSPAKGGIRKRIGFGHGGR